MSLPYIMVQDKLKNFLTEISSRGIPDNISRDYLKSIGYTSSNDRPIPQILRFLNMIDSKGKPNENYANFRDATQTKQVMGKLIKTAYSELITAFPKAYQEDKKKLDNWFKIKLGVADRTAEAAAATF